jgi:hypothetical protein
MSIYTPRLGVILHMPDVQTPVLTVPLIVSAVGPDGTVVGTAFYPFRVPQHVGPLFAYTTESEARQRGGSMACWMPGPPEQPSEQPSGTPPYGELPVVE